MSTLVVSVAQMSANSSSVILVCAIISCAVVLALIFKDGLKKFNNAHNLIHSSDVLVDAMSKNSHDLSKGISPDGIPFYNNEDFLSTRRHS